MAVIIILPFLEINLKHAFYNNNMFKIYLFFAGLLIITISILGILFGKEYSSNQINIGYAIFLSICLLPSLIYLTCKCQ